MHSNGGFLTTLDAYMLSCPRGSPRRHSKHPHPHQHAVLHLLFGRRKCTSGYEKCSCASNRSHHCDDLRRSYAGWVFMVFGCWFIRSHFGFLRYGGSLLVVRTALVAGGTLPTVFSARMPSVMCTCRFFGSSGHCVVVHAASPLGMEFAQDASCFVLFFGVFLGSWHFPGLQFYGYSFSSTSTTGSCCTSEAPLTPSGVEGRWPMARASSLARCGLAACCAAVAVYTACLFCK